MFSRVLKTYLDLTKFGIAIFAVLSALAGYLVAFPMGNVIEISTIVLLMAGLYLVCSGSFVLNQIQEIAIDKKMPRTAQRPLVKGTVSRYHALVMSLSFLLIGFFLLYLINPNTFALTLATVLMYNGLYTIYWKPRWAFAAVPGAIPGAMPVVIGYSVFGNVWDIQCLYLFLVMFLWQMPHFWALALRFKEDYKLGGIPVLPVVIGDQRTRYHIGLYLLAYVGVSLTLPLFVQANFLYLLLVLPMAVKLVFELKKFLNASEQKAWLPFFLWVNFSVIVFLLAPAVDQWVFYWSQTLG